MAADPLEHALTERLRDGDAAAVDELVATYGARIEQFALRHVRNQEDAEEVTQDVIMRVVQAIAGFRGDSALASWIYRITFNTSMSHLRRRRAAGRHLAPVARESESLPSAPASIDIPDWSAMADEAYLGVELRARLAEALRLLPDIYRVPVELRDLQGLTTAEASQRLGVTPQTVKSRLHRGRAILRPRLTEFWTGLALHRRAAAGSGRESRPAFSDRD